MNDCPKAELRDRLPDLLHERLDAFSRAAVISHLDECALCREELELLRGLRAVMARGGAVQIDVSRVVRALPAPSDVRAPARRVASSRGARRFTDWRVAAAVTMLLAAGTSVGAYLRIGGHGLTDSAVAQSHAVTRDTEALTKVALGPSELYVGGGLSDLTDDELQTLASDIEHFDALPASDPDAGLPVPLAAPEGL